MTKATARIAGVVPQVVEVALRYDPKCADGREHSALGSADLVEAVALSDRPTLAPTRQVEIPREDVTRSTVFVAVAFVASTTAATAISRFTTVAVIASRIVSVPHRQSPCEQPSTFAARAMVRRLSADCAQTNHGRQRIIRSFWLLSSRDRSCPRFRDCSVDVVFGRSHASRSLIPALVRFLRSEE